MKVLKWIVSFSITFLFAWVLIFTFIQEPFKAVAKARILTYWTPAIPIYAYVAGAFGIGLLLGLFAAFYYYVVMQRKVHQRTKELRELEAKLADAKRVLDEQERSHQYALPEVPSEVVPELPPETDGDLPDGGEPLSDQDDDGEKS